MIVAQDHKKARRNRCFAMIYLARGRQGDWGMVHYLTQSSSVVRESTTDVMDVDTNFSGEFPCMGQSQSQNAQVIKSEYIAI